MTRQEIAEFFSGDLEVEIKPAEVSHQWGEDGVYDGCFTTEVIAKKLDRPERFSHAEQALRRAYRKATQPPPWTLHGYFSSTTEDTREHFGVIFPPGSLSIYYHYGDFSDTILFDPHTGWIYHSFDDSA